MELKFTKKQRHTSWVCVGKSALDAEPTWFYAFRTYAKAQAFVEQAKGVAWEIYPCELEEPDEALRNFEECKQKREGTYVPSEGTFVFDPDQPVAKFVPPRSMEKVFVLDELVEGETE